MNPTVVQNFINPCLDFSASKSIVPSSETVAYDSFYMDMQKILENGTIAPLHASPSMERLLPPPGIGFPDKSALNQVKPFAHDASIADRVSPDEYDGVLDFPESIPVISDGEMIDYGIEAMDNAMEFPIGMAHYQKGQKTIALDALFNHAPLLIPVSPSIVLKTNSARRTDIDPSQNLIAGSSDFLNRPYGEEFNPSGPKAHGKDFEKDAIFTGVSNRSDRDPVPDMNPPVWSVNSVTRDGGMEAPEIIAPAGAEPLLPVIETPAALSEASSIISGAFPVHNVNRVFLTGSYPVNDDFDCDDPSFAVKAPAMSGFEDGQSVETRSASAAVNPILSRPSYRNNHVLLHGPGLLLQGDKGTLSIVMDAKMNTSQIVPADDSEYFNVVETFVPVSALSSDLPATVKAHKANEVFSSSLHPVYDVAGFHRKFSELPPVGRRVGEAGESVEFPSVQGAMTFGEKHHDYQRNPVAHDDGKSSPNIDQGHLPVLVDAGTNASEILIIGNSQQFTIGETTVHIPVGSSIPFGPSIARQGDDVVLMASYPIAGDTGLDRRPSVLNGDDAGARYGNELPEPPPLTSAVKISEESRPSVLNGDDTETRHGNELPEPPPLTAAVKISEESRPSVLNGDDTGTRHGNELPEPPPLTAAVKISEDRRPYRDATVSLYDRRYVPDDDQKVLMAMDARTDTSGDEIIRHPDTHPPVFGQGSGKTEEKSSAYIDMSDLGPNSSVPRNMEMLPSEAGQWIENEFSTAETDILSPSHNTFSQDNPIQPKSILPEGNPVFWKFRNMSATIGNELSGSPEKTDLNDAFTTDAKNRDVFYMPDVDTMDEKEASGPFYSEFENGDPATHMSQKGNQTEKKSHQGPGLPDADFSEMIPSGSQIDNIPPSDKMDVPRNQTSDKDSKIENNDFFADGHNFENDKKTLQEEPGLKKSGLHEPYSIASAGDPNHPNVSLKNIGSDPFIPTQTGHYDDGINEAVMHNGPEDLPGEMSAAKLSSQTKVDMQKLLEREAVNQIIDKAIVELREGKTELKIQIQPKSMGQIKIQLSSENDQVIATIMTETFHAKDILEQHMHMLVDELHAQGIDIDNVDVFMTNQDSGNYYSQKEEQPETERRTRVPHFPDEPLDDKGDKNKNRFFSKPYATNERSVDYYA